MKAQVIGVIGPIIGMVGAAAMLVIYNLRGNATTGEMLLMWVVLLVALALLIFNGYRLWRHGQ
jgi:hypothetical protein